METTKTLSKVLKVREETKSEVERIYHAKVHTFEQKATELYKVLKMKEDAEERYQKSMGEKATIDFIQQQSHHLLALDKQILHLQKLYEKARFEMEKEQENLRAAYIEVKKFESLIEKRVAEHEKVILRNERIMMDEISIQQYMNSRAR